MTDLLYIVSVSDADKEGTLPGVLWSLVAQSHQDFFVVVADNSLLYERRCAHQALVRDFEKQDGRFAYFATGVVEKFAGEYFGSERAAAAFGPGRQFLCFPSNDSYYTPLFAEALVGAAKQHDWGLVYCDLLYDRRWCGRYAVLSQRPKTNFIDKTGFIVRTSVFEQVGGFAKKPQYEIPGTARFQCSADGAFCEQVVAAGVRHGHVPECLVVHN